MLKISNRVMLGAALMATMVLQPAHAVELSAKSVVLVHGAFADGSSWKHVIPQLQKAGLNVYSVQNPLSSLADDVAHTNRAIERAEAPVVLVGHSWGGMVITEAGVHDKVQSLVYIAAYAPSKGESLLDTAADYPTPAGLENPLVDESGYITLAPDAIAKYFAQDVPAEETAIMATSQGPLNSAALEQVVTNVAWEQKPSWYAVSLKDNMTHTDLQKEFVKKLNATAIELDSSHTSMLSKPDDISKLIIDAAK